MTQTLKEQLQTLSELQKLDRQILEIQKQKKEVPNRLEELQAAIRQAAEQVTTKKSQVEEAQEKQLQLMVTLEENEKRISHAKKKLESVQNENEFNAANKEIDQITKMNKDLTLNEKTTTEAVETHKGRLEKFEEALKVVQAQRKRHPPDVESAFKQFDDQIATIESQREPFTSKVESSLLEQYQLALEQRAGIAVAEVTGSLCSACRMKLPPQLYNEILKGDAVHTCPTCRRILLGC